MNSKRVAFFLMLHLPLFTAAAQTDNPDEKLPAAQQGAFINSSMSGEYRDEIWLTLRSGSVISADRSDIKLQDGELRISGTLRDLSIPTADITGIADIPLKNRFRNSLIGASLLSGTMLLSPQQTPGYYLGSHSDESGGEFPGTTTIAVLLTAAVSLAVAFIADQDEPTPDFTALDGTENARAWARLLAPRHPRLHIRIAPSFVVSGIRDAWREHHDRFAIKDGYPDTWSYYYYEKKTKMTDFNMGRLFQASYSLSRDAETGVALQSDGVQRFREHASYIRPGNPPATVLQGVWSECRWTSAFLTGRIVAYRPTEDLSLNVGGGVGFSQSSALVSGFESNTSEQTLAERTQAAWLVFAAVEYQLDRNLSLGLHVDYSSAGALNMPEQQIRDNDRRSYLVIDAFKLPLRSAGLGIFAGFHF